MPETYATGIGRRHARRGILGAVTASRLAAIRDRIRLLAVIDRDRQIFGALTHRHELAPPLTEDGLGELESRSGALPDEYRRFLRTIGSRGAGPYYGLVEPAVPDCPFGPLQPDSGRVFRCDHETAYDTNIADGAHVLDGTLYLAEQGCGGRSLLVVRGPRAGEVWSDWTRERGTIAPEAPSFLVWYERWIDRALLDWIERAAPQLAIDGPSDAGQLEAIALAFELVEQHAPGNPTYLRTLGYLHMREGRWADADAAFANAAKAGEESEARLALDRARLAVKRGAPDAAILAAHRGLACEGLWYSTRDELRDTLERALAAAGRSDEALQILDERAAERHFSLDLHHRLARERLARNDLGNAGAALERAALMGNVLGRPLPLEDRVPASFDPIISELRAAGRHVDADALVAHASLILDAN